MDRLIEALADMKFRVEITYSPDSIYEYYGISYYAVIEDLILGKHYADSGESKEDALFRAVCKLPRAYKSRL